MSTGARKPVPKFASFQARKDTALDSKNETSPQRKSSSDTRHASKSDAPNDRLDGKYHRHRSYRHGRESECEARHEVNARRPNTEGQQCESRLVPSVRPNHRPISKALVTNSNHFKVDLEGDLDNLTYRSLHRYNVPAYHRSNRGFVLGAADYRIDRVASTENFLVLERRQESDSSRRLPGHDFRSSTSAKVRLVRPDPQSSERSQSQKTYISLNHKRRRIEASKECSPQENSADDEEVRSESSSASDSDEAPEFLAATQVRQKHLELQRVVDAEPLNVTAWLDLIQHQECVMNTEGSNLPQTLQSASARRSLAEIRITILEKAIAGVDVADPDYAKLWSGYMDEGARIWDTKKLDVKWKQAVQSADNNAELWSRRIDFVESNIAIFGVEKCKTLYIDALSSTKSVPEENTSPDTLHLFLRLTNFLRRAGYHETGEALWQALLEIKSWTLSEVSGDTTSVLNAFGQFWESEEPRIGEPGAQGWNGWLSQTKGLPTAQNDTDTGAREHLHPIPVRDLITSERSQAKLLSHPGRTLDDIGADDLFHTILFTDIEPFLRPMLSKVMAPFDIVQAHLCFLGLPPIAVNSLDNVRRFWLDPFLSIDPCTRIRKAAASLLRLMTTDVLFDDAFTDRSLLDIPWVLRTMEGLVNAPPMTQSDEAAEYFLALYLHFDPDNVRKTAKRLLKKRSQSLRLYNAYALIEHRLGNLDAAQQVWSTAINMSTAIPTERYRSAVLWRSWLLALLQDQETEHRARQVVLMVGEDQISNISDLHPSPAGTLRRRQYLAEGRDAAFLSRDGTLAAEFCNLSALVEYLNHGNDLGTAMDSYANSLQLLRTSMPNDLMAIERLQQSRAQLIQYHMHRVRIYNPVAVREIMQGSFDQFPVNNIFMEVFTENEERFNIDDRVRSLLIDLVEDERRNSIITVFQYILFETRRAARRNIGKEAMRAAFERSISTSIGSRSESLWTSFVMLELDSAGPKDARSVFYRGLQSLPGCKSYILLGLTVLSLTMEEQLGLLNMLDDKELRMHNDLGTVRSAVAST